MKRNDDYLLRREHLKNLTDEELHARFWELAGQLTEPLLLMGRENTTPSIERSVLLRMGFSSLESTVLVKICLEQGLLGHGAGHVVFRMSRAWSLGLREAGLKLVSGLGWEEAKALFDGGRKG
jgi:D-ornithine 4,5-aminomutase subunit alpha